MSEMLKLTNIDAGYGPKQVLRNVSLEVRAGEVVALLGPNGAGKSTVLKAISGLLRPSLGKIEFCDEDITKFETYRRVQKGIGYVMQNGPLFGSLTIAEHRRLAGGNSTEPVKFAIPDTKTGGVLSGGERQRLAVELCLQKQPKLLLLDEPSAGILPSVAKKLYAWVKSLIAGTDTAVLVVEQNLHFLPGFATRAAVMRNGEIYRDPLPLEKLEDYDAMFEVFYGDTDSAT